MISFSHKTAVSWLQRTAGPLKRPLAAKREGATKRPLKMMKCCHSPSWWTRSHKLGCYEQFFLLFSSFFQIITLSTSPHQSGLIILSILTWGNTKIHQREQRRRAKQGNECVWLLRNCLVELRLYCLVCVKVMAWKQEEHETTFSPYFHLLNREITSIRPHASGPRPPFKGSDCSWAALPHQTLWLTFHLCLSALLLNSRRILPLTCRLNLSKLYSSSV